MAHLAWVGPPTSFQVTCGAALRVLGHRVEILEPESVLEALVWLATGDFEAAVLDGDLPPPCPGESLLRAVHEEPELRILPRVALTRSLDPAFRGRLGRYGAGALLVAPSGSDALVEAVARVLRADRPCVVVVEPQATHREALVRALTAAGCRAQALEAPSVFALVRALRRVAPDGLCCPDPLPAFAAMSLLRALREDPVLRDLPVLVSAEDPDRAEASLGRFGKVLVLPREEKDGALSAWAARLGANR